uniref:Cyclic nucleotide-binding domain-containing protein n=1 Tax=Macrostomum lignano TaxID=282301 RepID=A0A1I8FDJ1_9PLAT
MNRGDWFGEKALKDEDVRTANIVVSDPSGVDCLLVLSRERAEEFRHLTLKDLYIVATLGVGGFGRVELVQINNDNQRSFALKQLRSSTLSKLAAGACLERARHSGPSANSDFVVKFYHGLRIAPALSYLHRRGHCVPNETQAEKPALLDSARLNCKLTDFGFAKRIGHLAKQDLGPSYVRLEGDPEQGPTDLSATSGLLGILMFEAADRRLQPVQPASASHAALQYSSYKGIDAVEFPRRVSRNAQTLIKKLCSCEDNPTDESVWAVAAFVEVSQHLRFEGFKLGRRCRSRGSLKPPHLPQSEQGGGDG